MIKKLCNLYIKHKTKTLTRIPLFTMMFDWKKFQEDGKKGSCLLYVIHPDIAEDLVLRKKLCDCVDYIRNNYDMEMFTKFQWNEFQVNGVEKQNNFGIGKGK